MIVIDTNVIGYLFLSSTHSDCSERVLRRDPEWIAPLLWRSEFRNVLALYMRKGILTLDEALNILDAAETVMQHGEYEVVSAQVLRLVQSSGCSAYDCEFVALAQDLNVRLVTADWEILRQFPDVAISLDAHAGA